MLNLLFVGSREKAKLYNSALKRIVGAKWVGNLDLDNNFPNNKEVLTADVHEMIINYNYENNE